MSGRDAVLRAFDRLFDRATIKLGVECAEADRASARRSFEDRFAVVLDAADKLGLDEVPEEVLTSMEDSIDKLSPAQVVGHLASIPLARQAQQVMQTLAVQAAQQRLADQLIEQADETYGGN